MKKIIFFLMAAVLTVGCKNDDTDFSEYKRSMKLASVPVVPRHPSIFI